jgi:protein SCO1/2
MPRPALRAIRTWICQVSPVSDVAIRRLSGRRLLVALLVVFLVAVIPSVVLPTLVCRPERKELKDLGTVTPFSLVDETNRPFTEAAMRGKVTIVGFIFTRCDTICPVIAMKMARIQEKTFDVGDKVKLVSFTVDPKHDTPEKLAAFAARYQADPERWHFVTGPYEKVYETVETIFMSSMMQNPDKPSGVPDFAHAGYFLLVDPQLVIRGKYDSDLIYQLDDLMRDARYLARTVK